MPYIHDIPTNLKRQTVLSKIDILRQCFKKTLAKQLSSFRTDCIHFRTVTVQEILCKTFGDSSMTYLSVLTPCTHISITAQPRSDGESQLQHPDLVLKGHKNIALLKSFSNIRSKPYSRSSWVILSTSIIFTLYNLSCGHSRLFITGKSKVIKHLLRPVVFNDSLSQESTD